MTYFVRKVVELYTFSTRVSEIVYRIIAPNFPQDCHTIDDIAWLPPALRDEIKAAVKLLPKVGEAIEQKPGPFRCRPTGSSTIRSSRIAPPQNPSARQANAMIYLEKQKAEVDSMMQLENERRRLLLDQGMLDSIRPRGAAGGLAGSPRTGPRRNLRGPAEMDRPVPPTAALVRHAGN